MTAATLVTRHFSRNITFMRLEKFTLRGQEAIQSAIESAERNQNQQVEPEHLLLAMLEQPEGTVRPVIAKLGVNNTVGLVKFAIAHKLTD